MYAGRLILNPTRRITSRIRIVTVFAIMAVLPFSTGVGAQDSTEYEAEILDWSIDVSGPNYVLENVDLEEYPHGHGERVYITSIESAGFVEVAFFDDEDTAEDTIELYLRDFRAASQSLEVLETGFADEIHYALARFQLDQGMAGYFYIEVAEDVDGNTDLAQSIYTLDADFLEQLDIARNEISLAGLPFLAEPVIDLASIIPADQALLASTPEPVPTPDQGSYTFRTAEVELVVQGSIEFDFPLFNRELDVMFLSSAHGYGIVGFIDQVADSPEAVLASVFLDAPTGEEAPMELSTESDDVRALGVYRVKTQGETRAMIIEVTSINQDRWRVEAMAVTESEFADELAAYQTGVTFDGIPLLDEIDADRITIILNEND